MMAWSGTICTGEPIHSIHPRREPWLRRKWMTGTTMECLRDSTSTSFRTIGVVVPRSGASRLTAGCTSAAPATLSSPTHHRSSRYVAADVWRQWKTWMIVRNKRLPISVSPPYSRPPWSNQQLTKGKTYDIMRLKPNLGYNRDEIIKPETEVE